MKIPELLLVGTAHQGRSPAEVNADINELANPDFRSRIDALPSGPKRGGHRRSGQSRGTLTRFIESRNSAGRIGGDECRCH
ncbi:MAG: hypothetical protein IPJ97_14510 [Proteobacteria bacterium]|nr:hypothetical protein [Pseudomonadota bacterium]